MLLSIQDNLSIFVTILFIFFSEYVLEGSVRASTFFILNQLHSSKCRCIQSYISVYYVFVRNWILAGDVYDFSHCSLNEFVGRIIKQKFCDKFRSFHRSSCVSAITSDWNQISFWRSFFCGLQRDVMVDEDQICRIQ